MTRAAIYSRISSDRDDSQLGVDRQEADCRRLCAERGWEVVDAYRDNDVSAAKPGKKRPAYQRLLGDITAGRVDAVVCWDADRLHRQPMELEEFVRTCDSAGMKTFASVTSAGTVDLNDPDALLMLRIKGNMAKREIDKTRQRIQRKKLELAERGLFSGGGTRPFGYESNGVTVRETEAILIREAADRILQGESLYAIRADWEARKVPTSTGARWSVQSIKRTLTRPRVAGLRQHQGDVIGEAAWPAILDRQVWEQVRAVLLDVSRRQPAPSRKYPLHRVLRCAECEHWLSAMPSTIRGRMYGCRKDGGGGRCGHVFVKADAVEARVWEVLLPVVDAPGLRDLIADEEGEVSRTAQDLVVGRAADEKMLEQLDNDYADGVMPRPAWLKQRGRLRKRVEERTARLSSLRGQSALGRLGENVAGRWDELSTDDQRLVCQSLLLSVDVSPVARRGSNLFDRERLRFLWRWDALARIAAEWERTATPEEIEAAEHEYNQLNEAATS